jgi:type I restriction enzyme M protein
MAKTNATLIWNIADMLRGPFNENQYGDVVLPFTILRRLDCMLEPTKDAVLAEYAKALTRKVDPMVVLRTKFKDQKVFNTSKWSMSSLISDPEGLADNLSDYIEGFSPNVRDVFESFSTTELIASLDKIGRLYLIVKEFASVDLHADAVSGVEMGYIFEHLIRKWADSNKTTAGDHFTPREVIELMVDLLFNNDGDSLQKPGAVRTIYDPTAGTGGMLSTAYDHLKKMNTSARPVLYGQEVNPRSYAMCKSDMVIKDQEADHIRFGDTLTEDHFAGEHFDFLLSNPPFGIDWKVQQQFVVDEHEKKGFDGRFGPGLPGVGDGAMLFLLHLIAKMRPAKPGDASDQGARAAIVLSGSPLFTGGAGSGPSEIRKWIIENDLLDAIIALPTDMFYNTGITTYIWILDNIKPAERQGKVQLISASELYGKMRKAAGSKRKELRPEDIARICELYDQFVHDDGTEDRASVSKVFNGTDFGYWTVTVERPLLDENGNPVTDRKGVPKPDPKKRDTENVPFTYGGNTDGDDGRDATTAAYFEAEVLPHVPDAWVDEKKTKVGYEIPFTRQFYKYVPPRPLAEIDAELEKQVAKIMELLREVEAP